jgi:hypothetical protein
MRERDFLFPLRPFLRRVFPVAVFFLKISVNLSATPHCDLELQNRTLALDVTTLDSPLNDGYSSLAPTQDFRTVEGNTLRQIEQKLTFLQKT